MADDRGYASLTKRELIERLVAAEEELRELRANHGGEPDRERLLQKLSVHQVELEAQNYSMHELQIELARSHHRYQELYDFAPVAYFAFDPNGVILESNLAGAALLGSTRSELVGRRLTLWLRPPDQARFAAHLRRALSDEISVLEELTISAARGVREVQLVSVAAGAVGSEGPSCRSALLDVTDQRAAEREAQRLQVERALRSRFEKLDQVVIATSLAVARTPTEDPDALLQIFVDEARSATTAESAAVGMGRGDGKPFDRFVVGGSRERISEAIGFPASHPPTGLLAVPIRYEGQARGHFYLANKQGAEEFSDEDRILIELLAERVGVVMEIARLRRAEGDLYHSAQTAIRARDNLLAFVSHDLRGYLSTVMMSAEVLARFDPRSDPEAAGKPLDAIRRSIRRMEELIGCLRDATMIETGHFKVTTGPEDLAAIFAEASGTLEPRASGQQLHFGVGLAEPLPRVRCDRERLIQVLSNLVGNAIKFTRPGGEIRVAARPLEGEVCVSVSDNGVGIPPAQLSQVFDQYWSGGARAEGGTGLGLYIVKGIVLAHGGRIWVESEPGVGTTFHFTLPVAGSMNADSPAPGP